DRGLSLQRSGATARKCGRSGGASRSGATADRKRARYRQVVDKRGEQQSDGYRRPRAACVNFHSSPGPPAFAVATPDCLGTRGALYEGVANEDSTVLSESKLAEWRKARERASFLRQRAGSDVTAVDERAFQFVRETTAVGKTVDFQFQFKALREGNDWRVDRVVAADLTPADALRGKAISEFS